MAIDRVRVNVAGGGVVGNAIMNWYFAAATSTNLSAINTFLTAFKTYIPSGCSYTIKGGGDTIDEKTGHLAGAWAVGADQVVTGSSASASSGQAGGMITWLTGAVVDGHHPRGRAILVPLSGAAFAPGGGMLAAWITAANAAASAFITASSGFVIWHRPVYAGKPPDRVLKREGSTVAALSGSASNVSATLRSRNH